MLYLLSFSFNISTIYFNLIPLKRSPRRTSQKTSLSNLERKFKHIIYMGKPSRQGQSQSQAKQKNKGVKKQRERNSKKQDQDVGSKPGASIQIDDGLNIKDEDVNLLHEELKGQIQKEMAPVISLYKKLEAFGMSNQIIHQIESVRRVGEQGQKAAEILINKYVIDSQNVIFDAQREIFKKVSDLERAQQKSRNILTGTKGLTLEEVDQIMGHLDTKMQELKQKIYNWNKVVEKGDEALGKSKIQQQ